MNYKYTIVILIILAAVMLIVLGFLFGFKFGMDREFEIHKQVACENGHYKSFADIPGDCIKYLTK